jgi:hypothetical protein
MKRANLKLTNALLFPLVLGASGLTGCNSSADIFSEFAVEGVSIDGARLSIGSTTRTEVFFETKLFPDGEPKGLEVVAMLTPSLSYVEGSSRLYDGSTSRSERRTPDRVVRCQDGSIFIVYDFSDSELDGRSLVGDNDFGLHFDIKGERADDDARVEAAAGEDQEFDCDRSFGAEESDSIVVE